MDNNIQTISLDKVKVYFAKLYENSQSVHWLTTPDLTKIHYISPAYEKIWGRDREILYHNRNEWTLYLHPEEPKDRRLFHEFAELAAKSDHEVHYQETYRIITPDNQVRYILDQGYPVYDENGKCCSLTGIALDITEQYQLHSSLQAKNDTQLELCNKIREKLNINLNDKEIACLKFWLGGISIKETAHRLNLSSKTIEAYRGIIKHKMAVHHKFQLMQRLLEKGVLDLCTKWIH